MFLPMVHTINKWFLKTFAIRELVLVVARWNMINFVGIQVIRDYFFNTESIHNNDCNLSRLLYYRYTCLCCTPDHMCLFRY